MSTHEHHGDAAKGEGQSAKSASVDPQSTWESAREIYKVRDGRIAADDVQASILAGSAAAVATIGSAAIRDANDSALWLIAIVALTGLTALLLSSRGARSPAGEV